MIYMVYISGHIKRPINGGVFLSSLMLYDARHPISKGRPEYRGDIRGPISP